MSPPPSFPLIMHGCYSLSSVSLSLSLCPLDVLPAHLLLLCYYTTILLQLLLLYSYYYYCCFFPLYLNVYTYIYIYIILCVYVRFMDNILWMREDEINILSFCANPVYKIWYYENLVGTIYDVCAKLVPSYTRGEPYIFSG